MKLIGLTNGFHAQVDDGDYEVLSQKSWYAHKDNKTGKMYARSMANIDGKQRTVLMHREVLGLPFGDRRQADHIESSQTLNNQRSNLRIASCQQNRMNSELSRRNTSGYKGVTRRGKRWRATITFNYQVIELGLYDDPQTAHQVYWNKAQELHGAFARKG